MCSEQVLCLVRGGGGGAEEEGGGDWCNAASENYQRIAQGSVVILCMDFVVLKLASFAERFKNFTTI
jgi:hypothetical protein